MTTTISVIVSTYNKPFELDLVLCGLNKQVISPIEILIADDGSTNETEKLIKKRSENSSIPINHIWHEDKGNRKFKICNEAANKATGSYLLFLDGDAIPHRYWTHDHFKCAKQGTVLCGRRVRLGPKISQTINTDFVNSGKLEKLTGELLSSALQKDTKRFMLGVRLPKLIARCFHPTERRLMGVNFSLHKDLFNKVGGYSERFEKLHSTSENIREDALLEIQLLKAGVIRYPLINRAIVYHLYHPERPVEKELDNSIQQLYLSALQQRKTLN